VTRERKPLWLRTGRITSGVVAVLIVAAAIITVPGSSTTSDDEGQWLDLGTPTTTAATFTPRQLADAMNTPAGRQALVILDAVTAQRAPGRVGQRAVGLSGPVGADIDGITATATLSPGARIEKALSGVTLPDLGSTVTVALKVLVVAAGAHLLLTMWATRPRPVKR
jgi:hypothetical protein